MAPTHFSHLILTPTMRPTNAKTLLCWPSRMRIYGFVENHTFFEQLVRMGVPAQFVRMGVPAQFARMGVPAQFFRMGVPGHFFQSGGTRTFFPIWGTSAIFQSGGTSTIFSTLHGCLWLGKDKGSIMKSAESGGTIHL